MSLCSTSIVLNRCANYAHSIVGSTCTTGPDTGVQYVSGISTVDTTLKAADYIRTLNHWSSQPDFGREFREIVQNAIDFVDESITSYKKRSSSTKAASRIALYNQVKDLLLQYRDQLDTSGSTESIMITWSERRAWYMCEMRKKFTLCETPSHPATATAVAGWLVSILKIIIRSPTAQLYNQLIVASGPTRDCCVAGNGIVREDVSRIHNFKLLSGTAL